MPLVRYATGLLRIGTGFASSTACCCGVDCSRFGGCLFVWNGVAWDELSSDCIEGSTPATPEECGGVPGGVWGFCDCPPEPEDPRPGDFVGEVRLGCCVCTLECPIIP